MHDKTILIADNSIINRMQMGGILASEYNILEADNGHDALDIMRERGEDGIDAVLLDLHMPGQTGFDVLAEKQANPAIADIPVIVITADSVTAAEVHALDAGAADFLTKPIEPEIMRRRVSLVINARELEEQRMRVRMLEEAAWITDHDDLTGLYTRKAFLREMQGMIDTHPDQEYLLTVWDFENFKTFNELFGTALGDKMLIAAARCMDDLFAGGGVYGRLGNDNFVFCFREGDADIEQVMEGIIGDISRLLSQNGIDFAPSLATGVYLVEDTDVEVSVMLDRAMMARNTIKGDYDRHIAYYNSELTDRMLEEQDILNNMEHALENGEFQVQLQPVYGIDSNQPVSAEALVRWHRPGHGIVSPGVFVPLFEENGFISKMDHSIWEQVCQILASRHDRGLPEIPISVNLSRRSIFNSSLYDEIVALVEKYGIEPRLFRIEVTESSYTENIDLVISMVTRLQDYGFTVLMDDFGSGYSSFNAFSDIPVDILKADMVFMRNLERNPRVASVFTSIVNMAHSSAFPSSPREWRRRSNTSSCIPSAAITPRATTARVPWTRTPSRRTSTDGERRHRDSSREMPETMPQNGFFSCIHPVKVYKSDHYIQKGGERHESEHQGNKQPDSLDARGSRPVAPGNGRGHGTYGRRIRGAGVRRGGPFLHLPI